jgi:uncharacterized surface protein with fasciclin (FAS1) repeats
MSPPFPSFRLFCTRLLVLFLCCCYCVNSQLNNAATLQNDARLSKFVQQLDRAGISPNIGETIFAPSNDAYDRFRVEDSLRWRKYTQQAEFFVHVRDVQLWHFVTDGSFTLNEIFDGRRNTLENQLGNITVSQQFRRLDNVPDTDIVESDIATSQGTIHVVDQVILPPYLGMNMIENLLQDRHFDFAFTTMANIALWAELDDELNRAYDFGITFLVPPNRRFNRAEIDVRLLLTEKMREYTRAFVRSHMIKRNYYEAGIFALNEENGRDQFLETSMLGTHIWITTTENKVRFQSTDVRLFDQPTQNGYVVNMLCISSGWVRAYGLFPIPSTTQNRSLTTSVTPRDSLSILCRIFHGLDFPLKPPFASDFAEFTHMSTSYDTSDCFRFFRQTLLSSEDISNMFDTSITLWCPTTEAFAFFNNEDFNRLLEPIWVRHATEFLLNHMSAPAITRNDFVNMAPGFITMLNGATYELRKSGPRPRIKNGPEQARSDFGDLISVDG